MWFWLMNAITLRSSWPFDQCDEVVAHRELVVVAQLEDPVREAVVDQCALTLRERVRQHDGHQVLGDHRLCLRGPSTGVLVEDLDRRGRDHLDWRLVSSLLRPSGSLQSARPRRGYAPQAGEETQEPQ